jgi:nitronate monooxygenase
MYEEGDLDAGALSCGQGVGLAHDIPSIRELFDRMMVEAEGVVKRFATA